MVLLGTEAARGDETFLDGLTPGQLEQLRAAATTRNLARGAVLFHEQQQSDRVVAIVSGCVKLSRISDEGREVILGIRAAGELIGEMSGFDGEPRSATATALEPLEVLIIPVEDFNSFLRNNPDAALLIIRVLSRRLRDADRKRFEFAAQDTMGRVAARLVELAERFGEEAEGGIRIDLPLSQEEIAGWAGSSREAVSKALGTMRELGWLETQRRSITVCDAEALRRRAVCA
jgi:CRP/FNR family transcriptional regulator, cyclic AMP receptor protein